MRCYAADTPGSTPGASPSRAKNAGWVSWVYDALQLCNVLYAMLVSLIRSQQFPHCKLPPVFRKMKFEDLEVWKRSARLSVELYKYLADCRDYGFKDPSMVSRKPGSIRHLSMLNAFAESCRLNTAH